LNENFTEGRTNKGCITFPDHPNLSEPSNESDDTDYCNFKVYEMEVIGFPLSKKEMIDINYDKMNKAAKFQIDIKQEDNNPDKFILKKSGIIKDYSNDFNM
jgi:hypothetical protein